MQALEADNVLLRRELHAMKSEEIKYLHIFYFDRNVVLVHACVMGFKIILKQQTYTATRNLQFILQVYVCHCLKLFDLMPF